MTIIQMECFVEAAKWLNFTKAADHLYISQQTMSRQIKALENELGFPVFERKNVGVRSDACRKYPVSFLGKPACRIPEFR